MAEKHRGVLAIVANEAMTESAKKWLFTGIGALPPRILLFVELLLRVFLLLGSFFLFYGLLDNRELHDLMTEGVEADATIEKVQINRHSIGLDLVWKDAAGATRRLENVRLSDAYAKKIISGGRVARPSIAIKYLQHPGAGVVFLDDANDRSVQDRSRIILGAILSAGSLLGLWVYFRWCVQRMTPAAAGFFNGDIWMQSKAFMQWYCIDHMSFIEMATLSSALAFALTLGGFSKYIAGVFGVGEGLTDYYILCSLCLFLIIRISHWLIGKYFKSASGH